jgi:hypothetical protein
MAANTFKNPVSESNAGNERPGQTVLLPWLEGSISLAEFFREGIPARHLPKIAFSFLLCLLYIGISHQSNRTIQRLNKSKTLLEDLRVNYTTQKAELMYRSKQSEMAKLVAPLGLEESETPPQKISLKEE